MTADDPRLIRYLAALDETLSRRTFTALLSAERTEVVEEIRQHIADAGRAGRSVEQVLQSLGPVEALARGYELELLVGPRTAERNLPVPQRWLRVISVLALGSATSIAILVTLTAAALALVLFGLGFILSGAADTPGALPDWFATDPEPWFAIVVGTALTAVGVLCGLATGVYLKFAVRTVRAVVPKSA